jgi:hypothetical protein
MSWFARYLSPRIRELERINADLNAMLGDDFGKVSMVQMNYTPMAGLKAAFEGPNMAKLLAWWGFNTLEACDAKNFVEFQVNHPDSGTLVITVQRKSGETPGSKIERLEREITELNRGCYQRES